MIKTISELTYKMVAFPEIRQVNSDEGIDWAIEMILLGHESPSLFMLASFNKPTNYFEIINYVKSAIEELGLKTKQGEDAILSYASYYIHKIANKEEVRKNLTILYKFCQTRDYEVLVSDFYRLYWAWDQLDYEDIGYNHYWNGVKRDNIEQTTINAAKEWIEKNKENYLQ